MNSGFFSNNKVCGLSPHAFSRKLNGVAIDPVSAGLAGASLIGNWISSAKNRKQQYKMFQQQLAWQENQNNISRQWSSDEASKQRNFDSEQAVANWNRNEQSRIQQNLYNTNERLANEYYNSMEQQVKRAREAGINPALALGASSTVGSAGVAGSSNTSSAASGAIPSASVSNSAPAAPNIQPTTFDVHDLVGSLYNKASIGADINKKNSEAKGQDLQNQWFVTTLLAKLENLRQDTNNKALEGDIKDLQYKLLDQGFADSRKQQSADARRATNEADISEAQSAIAAYQQAMTYTQMKALPQQIQLGISNQLADINKKYAEVRESRARAYYYRTQGDANVAQKKVYEKQADLLDSQEKKEMAIAIQNGYSGAGRYLEFGKAYDMAEELFKFPGIRNNYFMSNMKDTHIHKSSYGFQTPFGVIGVTGGHEDVNSWYDGYSPDARSSKEDIEKRRARNRK